MTEHDILNDLTQILRDLLSDDSVMLTMDTKRDDVAGWDSFTYVNFIVSVEMKFGVKFRVADVESFQNVGAIVGKIESILVTHQQSSKGSI